MAARPARGAARYRPLRVVWEGPFFAHQSLALVNRELCLRLIEAGHEVSLIPAESDELAAQFEPEAAERYGELASRVRAPLSGLADFHVRHRWPPDFIPPPVGRWLMIQPWEYGVVPKVWVAPIEHLLDEVWVPSNHVRRAFIAAGAPTERVVVVPNGVNLALFHPNAPPRALPTARRCKFLFVGGAALWRKGVDVLLGAYRQAFTRRDDVCLVLKDVGQGTLYGGEIGGLLSPFEHDPDAPELLYLFEPIGEAEMPGLYTACDALVQPFRGEGYGLPVAEALACGRPAIVTRGGACDDFCPEAAAYWLPGEPRPAELPWETVPQAWVLEPDPQALASHLRAVYARPEEAKARGTAGAAYAQNHLGWEHAARVALARLEELQSRPPRREVISVAAGKGRARSAATKAAALSALEIGRAHAKDGAWDAAARQLARALRSDPGLVEAHLLLGPAEWRRGRPAQAVGALRRAAELAPDAASVHHTLALALQATGDVQGAEAALRRAVELEPGRAAAWRHLTKLLEAQGRWDEAAAASERSRAWGPFGPLAPNGMIQTSAREALDAGRAHADAGRWDEAAKDLSRALDLDPLLAEAHYLLGYVEVQRGRPAMAVHAFRQAVELSPGSADFRNALGVALHLTGDHAGAEAALRHVLASHPARGDVWGNLGELYEAQGRRADAAHAYEQAAALGDARGEPGVERCKMRPAQR